MVQLINENRSVTRKELADKLDITPDGVKYNLNKLVNSGIIERVGPKNGGILEC